MAKVVVEVDYWDEAEEFAERVALFHGYKCEVYEDIDVVIV